MPPVFPPANAPTISNTGAITPIGSLVTYSGGPLNVPGEMYQGYYFNGTATVQASNVRFYDCAAGVDPGALPGYPGLAGAPAYNLDTRQGTAQNVVATRCTFRGASSSNVIGSNVRLIRCQMYASQADGNKIDAGAGLLAENFEMCGCYVWGLGHTTLAPSAHVDGFQAIKGTTMRFIGNRFDIPFPQPAPFKGNSCLILEADLSSSVSDIIVQGNIFNGGNYSIQLGADAGLSLSNVTITDNWFTPNVQFGLISTSGEGSVSFFGRNNRWLNTGELIMPGEIGGAYVNPNQ